METLVDRRRVLSFGLALMLGAGAAADLAAQTRGGAVQGRGSAVQGRGGRGQAPRDAGSTPREIQAQFDAYVIAQAESALQISEEQYPQFVRRVRALQAARREARMRRNRLLAQINQQLRAGEATDDAKLTAAARAVDEHERATLADVQKAYASIDEVLTPWQSARFRVLEDQLEQKKLDMLFRARQGPRR